MTTVIRVPHGSTRAEIPGMTVAAEDLESNAVETVKIANSAVTAAKIASSAVETAKLNNLAVTAAKLAADAVETAKIKDLNVTTGKLSDGAVTAVKIADAALKYSGFTGKNGAGACTLTGAKVDDVVAGVVNITDGGNVAASFETVITVADQIQQSSASDLSTKKFSVLLVKKGA